MKFRLLIGLSTLAFMATSQAVSGLDVNLNGRVDFELNRSQSIADGTLINANVTSTTAASRMSAYQDDSRSNAETAFETSGRVDFSVGGNTSVFDYGGFVRFDFNADAGSVSDVDSHLYFSGAFGKLQLGTDIDADLGAFDASLMSAGPLSPGKGVTLPVAGHEFSMASHDSSSIVYTTPVTSNIRMAFETDGDGDWMVGGEYKSVWSGMDLAAQAAIDEAGAFAIRGKLINGDLAFGAFGGVDDDDESYIGGGVSYALGAWNFSVDGSIADAEYLSASSVANAQETDLIAGANYKLASGLSVAASIGHYSRDVEGGTNGSALTSVTSSGHDLSGTMASGRIRLDF